MHNWDLQPAKQRGRGQIGTLGSGNHFLEVQVVDEVFDARAAAALGVDQVGQVVVFVHCGSRGLGHQVCTDYLRVAERSAREHGSRWFSAIQRPPYAADRRQRQQCRNPQKPALIHYYRSHGSRR